MNYNSIVSHTSYAVISIVLKIRILYTFTRAWFWPVSYYAQITKHIIIVQKNTSSKLAIWILQTRLIRLHRGGSVPKMITQFFVQTYNHELWNTKLYLCCDSLLGHKIHAFSNPTPEIRQKCCDGICFVWMDYVANMTIKNVFYQRQCSFAIILLIAHIEALHFYKKYLCTLVFGRNRHICTIVIPSVGAKIVHHCCQRHCVWATGHGVIIVSLIDLQTGGLVSC